MERASRSPADPFRLDLLSFPPHPLPCLAIRRSFCSIKIPKPTGRRRVPPKLWGWCRMAISFLLFAARRRPKGWTSFVIFTSRLASRSIAPVKPATLRSPASFTVVIKVKSAFQEAWSCMVFMLQKLWWMARRGKGCGGNDERSSQNGSAGLLEAFSVLGVNQRKRDGAGRANPERFLPQFPLCCCLHIKFCLNPEHKYIYGD